jgi:hypothetical protein
MNILDYGINDPPKLGSKVGDGSYGIHIYNQGEGTRGDNIYLFCFGSYWVTGQSYFIPSNQKAFNLLCDTFGFDVILQMLLDNAGLDGYYDGVRFSVNAD